MQLSIIINEMTCEGHIIQILNTSPLLMPDLDRGEKPPLWAFVRPRVRGGPLEAPLGNGIVHVCGVVCAGLRVLSLSRWRKVGLPLAL